MRLEEVLAHLRQVLETRERDRRSSEQAQTASLVNDLWSAGRRGLSRAHSELEPERPYNARQRVQCRIPFWPKCLIHRLPADAGLTCDLGHTASPRYVSQGRRD